MFLSLFFFVNGYSQTKPIYFEGNRVTVDPKKATAYGVYGKLSNQELWVLKKYDLDDNLIVSGSYKDSLLSIAQGNFTFYNSVFDYNDKNFTGYKLGDTDRYISQKGTYKEGLEDGLWYTYYPNGTVMMYYTFINGKLNGAVKSFSAKSRLLFLGQYKDGLKDGIWYDLKNKFKDTYQADSLLNSSKLTRTEILNLK